MHRTLVNRRAVNSAEVLYDRDIFLLIIVVALGLCVNSRGLVGLIRAHFPASAALRLPAYTIAIASGAVVGLFSTRIASRITSWRDDNPST